MVQLPADMLTGSDQGMTGSQADLVTDLLAEVAELRERLARAETGLEAVKTVAETRVEAAKDAAAARVTAAKTEVAAVRELADRLTHELLEARLELAETRRPWWQRLFR